jgi:hypothetical protein
LFLTKHHLIQIGGGNSGKSRSSTLTGLTGGVSEISKSPPRSSGSINKGIIFSKRDIGEGSARFLARVRESQMFCNYNYAQSLKRRALRHQLHRELTAKSLLEMNIEDEEHIKVPISTRLAVSKIPSYNFNNEEREEDPLIALFKVIFIKKSIFFQFLYKYSYFFSFCIY